MPTYMNSTDDPVTVQQFDPQLEVTPDGSWITRAVPLPLITIEPGESADLPQPVDGNVLQLVP